MSDHTCCYRDEARYLTIERDTAEAEVKRLTEALREAQAAQPTALEMIRNNGFVFKTNLAKPDLTEAERWEKLAFSLYTDLCQVETIARNALEEER